MVFPMFAKNTRSYYLPLLSTSYRQSAAMLHLALLLTCFAVFVLGNIDFVSAQAVRAKPSTKTTDDEQTRPEEVTLKTKDKVQLVCTYFAPVAAEASAAEESKPDTDGAEPADGKRVIPYIILHDWKSSRADTAALAKFLSDQGNAVITPDLRGHGDSTKIAGIDTEIDAADFKPSDIGTVLTDIERCKRFLVKKNNSGELNIDMLAVIAIGKTVPLAAQWVVSDWTSYAPFKNGIKQGQDVKALIMIAPEKTLGPFSMNRCSSASIFAGKNALPTIVAWGTESEKAKEALSIYNRLKKKRPKGSSADTKTLFQAPLRNSSLNGVQIGSDENLGKLWSYFHKTVFNKINKNIDKLPWQDRSKKNN